MKSRHRQLSPIFLTASLLIAGIWSCAKKQVPEQLYAETRAYVDSAATAFQQNLPEFIDSLGPKGHDLINHHEVETKVENIAKLVDERIGLVKVQSKMKMDSSRAALDEIKTEFTNELKMIKDSLRNVVIVNPTIRVDPVLEEN